MVRVRQESEIECDSGTLTAVNLAPHHHLKGGYSPSQTTILHDQS